MEKTRTHLVSGQVVGRNKERMGGGIDKLLIARTQKREDKVTREELLVVKSTFPY